MERTNRKKQNTLAIFIVLAFGITWLGWLPSLIIADQQGYVLPTIANFTELRNAGFSNAQHVLLSILFSLAVYGPLVAAVVVTSIEGGKRGLAELVERTTKWRVNLKWYAIILGLALLLPLVPRLIGELAGLMQASQTAVMWTVPLLISLFFWQVLTSGLGEEPGWRGYLLPHLQSRYSSDKAIWLLGIIWAVWHYPFTIYDTLSKAGGVPVTGMVFTIIMALLGQTLSLVGMTYIYVWLYNKTRSVFITILFHALSNFLPAVLLVGLSPSLSITIALMHWVVVFVLEKIYGKDRFPGE